HDSEKLSRPSTRYARGPRDYGAAPSLARQPEIRRHHRPALCRQRMARGSGGNGPRSGVVVGGSALRLLGLTAKEDYASFSPTPRSVRTFMALPVSWYLAGALSAEAGSTNPRAIKDSSRARFSAPGVADDEPPMSHRSAMSKSLSS